MKEISITSKNQSFSVKTLNNKIIDAMLTSVDIYVLYTGINRNNSHFTKENIIKALPSVFNKPIIGEYLSENKNFGDHAASLEVNENNEFEVVVSTRPYGLIPESATFRWEDVTEEDGVINEYLVIEGALLWSGRYPEVNTIHESGFYGQSMEIEIENGRFEIIDGNEVFDIKDFIFSGFCLLGINKESDPEGHVEPCFEKSKVVAYSLNKESFTKEFEQMMAEFKFSLEKKSLEKGGNLVVKETNKIVIDENGIFVEGAAEQVKKKQEDNPEAPVITEEENKTVVPVAEEENVQPQTEGNEGDESVVDSEAFTELQENYSTLKLESEKMQAELNTLREYKHSRDLQDLKEKFSSQLTEQEIDGLFTENASLEIGALETIIFAMIGKKNYSLEPKQKTNKVPMSTHKSEEINPYGNIFEQ